MHVFVGWRYWYSIDVLPPVLFHYYYLSLAFIVISFFRICLYNQLTTDHNKYVNNLCRGFKMISLIGDDTKYKPWPKFCNWCWQFIQNIFYFLCAHIMWSGVTYLLKNCTRLRFYVQVSSAFEFLAFINRRHVFLFSYSHLLSFHLFVCLFVW